MSRFRFDQFSKQYLEELLTPLGEVTIGKKLLGEARQIDVWFVQLSPAYIQRCEEAVQVGMQLGRQEGMQVERRTTLEMLLRSQFGDIDPDLEVAMLEERSLTIAKMIELPVSDFAERISPLQ